MIRCGSPPYLECSSKGDRRYSAFFARVNGRGGRSIEELYQAAKVFPDGSTGLSPKEAKGKAAVNMPECHALYTQLWVEYFNENPHLRMIVFDYRGTSDIFGQEGHACQATVIYALLWGNAA